MIRVQTNNLFVTYKNFDGSVEEVADKLSKFENIIVGESDSDIDVLIYQQSRFNIRTDKYILKTFGIRTNYPNVNEIKHGDVRQKIKEFCSGSYKPVLVKGKFESIYNEVKKEIEDVKDDKIRTLTDRVHELERQVIERKSETTICNNTTNNTTNINITNITCPNIMAAYKNVNTRNLGEENLSSIRIYDYLNVLGDNANPPTVQEMMRRSIEIVHFNEDCPENNNIFITEKNNNPTCTVKIGGSWRLNEPLSNVSSSLIRSVHNFAAGAHESNREKYIGPHRYQRLVELESVSEEINPQRLGLDKIIYSLTKTKVPQLVQVMQMKKIE